MTEINAKIVIDQDTVHQILSNFDIDDDIENWVANNLDVDEQIETWVDKNLNVDNLIDNWMDYNFNIEDHLRDIDFSEYIDNGDVEGEARNLLEQYSPVTSCSTGQAFTEAVGKAVRHLLLNNDYVDYLVKALDRHSRAKIKSEIENEMKNEIAAELKATHFEEFKRQLEEMKNESTNSFSIITAQNR